LTQESTHSLRAADSDSDDDYYDDDDDYDDDNNNGWLYASKIVITYF